MNPDDPTISPEERRRAAVHRERAEAIDGLRAQIEELEAREPELRKEVVEFEKTRRTTIAELEKTLRMTVAELEKSHRARLAELEQRVRAAPEDDDTPADELARTRTELSETLTRTRSELTEELARTRSELDQELAAMRSELASIPPAVIDARCTLGMKMSDFALEEHEGHEQAIEYLQPLLVELRSTYRRALRDAERSVAEADEELRRLQDDRQDTADAALPLIEQRFLPLIDAEVTAVTIEQAQVRVARHRLAVLDSASTGSESDDDEIDPRLARELELEAAIDELDAARAKVAALQEEQRTAEYHYAHPTAEKSKRLGGKLANRLRRQH